jgi:2,4-dienoyl-CoA reductase-like NADH-dependent reductase (Old Yellow Enzyme family)
MRRHGPEGNFMPNRKNSIVFQPARIGTLDIKNRLIRSATFEHAAAENGDVSDALTAIHRNLAAGGAGLIMTGITWVVPGVHPPPMTLRADDDAFIPGLAQLARAVHKEAPDCRIMLQLHHPGRQVVTPADAARMASFRPPAYLAFTAKHPELISHAKAARHIPEPVAPSAVYDSLFNRAPRVLSAGEIEQIIDAYAEGIRRAEEAGFDGVQLHAAHGWLLSSFLSPATNRRADAYGGSTENRTRIVTEIYQRIRKKTGSGFPILIKYNADDFLAEGMNPEEAIRVGKILCETGFAALEVSGGMWEAVTRTKEELGWPPLLLPEARTGIRTREQEAYFLPAAAALKKNIATTVISVGGYRSFGRVEEALKSGAADFISLARPLVRQPDLPRLWYTGETDRAACISCNSCLPIGVLPLACRAESDLL